MMLSNFTHFPALYLFVGSEIKLCLQNSKVTTSLISRAFQRFLHVPKVAGAVAFYIAESNVLNISSVLNIHRHTGY